MSEVLTQSSVPTTRRSLGDWIWFALMAGGWVTFLGLLLFSEPRLRELYETIRDLPLLIEGLVWLVFFPFMLAVTVWESSWDTWLRVLAVCSLLWAGRSCSTPGHDDGAQPFRRGWDLSTADA